MNQMAEMQVQDPVLGEIVKRLVDGSSMPPDPARVAETKSWFDRSLSRRATIT
jgi:hypothetical protein